MEFSLNLNLASITTTVPRISPPPVRLKGGMRFQTKCHFTVQAARYHHNKEKVVFILGTTATGKSNLGIELATHFDGEIINSDKIQVYKGLDILTNKVPENERRGVPHHLIGFLDPEEDYTPQDFSNDAHMAINHVLKNGHIPIVTGGSNRYMEALVEDPSFNFQAKFDTCFLWVDVALPVLYNRAAKRIDQMLDRGIIDEVREVFAPGKNYNQGIWRSTGVQELDKYFHAEMDNADEATKKVLLDIAIKEIKENTNKLVNSQLKKINRLRNELGWKIHRIDATRVYERSGEDARDAWVKFVLKPSLAIVSDFLKDDEKDGEVETKLLELQTSYWEKSEEAFKGAIELLV